MPSLRAAIETIVERLYEDRAFRMIQGPLDFDFGRWKTGAQCLIDLADAIRPHLLVNPLVSDRLLLDLCSHGITLCEGFVYAVLDSAAAEMQSYSERHRKMTEESKRRGEAIVLRLEQGDIAEDSSQLTQLLRRQQAYQREVGELLDQQYNELKVKNIGQVLQLLNTQWTSLADAYRICPTLYHKALYAALAAYLGDFFTWDVVPLKMIDSVGQVYFALYRRGTNFSRSTQLTIDLVVSLVPAEPERTIYDARKAALREKGWTSMRLPMVDVEENLRDSVSRIENVLRA